MIQTKKRGVGALMLGAAIWLLTFGCVEDGDDGGPTGGTHQGGSRNGGGSGPGGLAGNGGGSGPGGVAGNGGTAGNADGDTANGGNAGGAAGTEADSGGAAGSPGTGEETSGGAGQGGAPAPGEVGRAGGGASGGDGGTAVAGAGPAGEPGSGRVDCGGQNCDLCCYDAFGGKPEFECAPVDDPPPNCGTDTVFDMTCDAKADCASGEVCCMERTKTSMLASATCRPKCPVSDNTTMHYELCGGDEECTAPKRCVKLPSLYFRVCR